MSISSMTTTQQLSLDDFLSMPLDVILREASRIRDKQFGNEIEFCSIINAKSGHCSMDCRFCAQSVHHRTQMEAYPLLSGKTIVAETKKQWRRGIHRIGWVTSGCSASDDEISKIVDAAGRCHGAGRLCASLGQLNLETLQKLKDAGISCYHHNLETSEAFYPSICGTQRWSDRLATVIRAKNVGMKTCCGGLFGLGESWQDRYELAIALQRLEVDSIPINFLSPIPGTPLADRPKLPVEEALRIIAMFRLLLPKASIRICGGRPTTFGNRQSEILQAGASALMTGDYLTTDGISPENDMHMIRQHGFDSVSLDQPKPDQP